MTEIPDTTPVIIYSRLMKGDYLASDSATFPRLVRGACASQRQPYNENVLMFVAHQREILDHLQMVEGKPFDEALRQFSLTPDTADAMDQIIMDAVDNFYKEA